MEKEGERTKERESLLVTFFFFFLNVWSSKNNSDVPTLGPPLPSVWPLNVGFQLLGHYAARNSRLGHISLSFCISAHLLISLFCSGLLRESAIHYMNLGSDVESFLLDLNKCNSLTVHITVCHSTDINVGTTSENTVYIYSIIYINILFCKRY